MTKITVVNIKCGGCEKSIISALQKKGLTDVKVDVEKQMVSFNGDSETAKKTLSLMGYPQAGSKEAKSLLKKAVSYLSCMVGRLQK